MVADERDLGVEIDASAPKSVRYCVQNTASKKARYGVPDFIDRPLACIHGDQGPIDNPISWFLPANGFRIWVFMDPLHKCPRDLYAAAVASGNWNMILDTTYAINFYGGPFRSKAHWHQAREKKRIGVNPAQTHNNPSPNLSNNELP